MYIPALPGTACLQKKDNSNKSLVLLFTTQYIELFTEYNYPVVNSIYLVQKIIRRRQIHRISLGIYPCPACMIVRCIPEVSSVRVPFTEITRMSLHNGQEWRQCVVSTDAFGFKKVQTWMPRWLCG